MNMRNVLAIVFIFLVGVFVAKNFGSFVGWVPVIRTGG